MGWRPTEYYTNCLRRKKAGSKIESVQLGSSSQETLTPNHNVVTKLHLPRWRFNSIWHLVLSVYSTGLSGTWLVMACVGLRYEYMLAPSGPFLMPTISTGIAFFAKTIEISFVAVFVTFLGQILTRRSMSHGGISLAQMAMRNWVTQPGAILTQSGSVRSAGLSSLGVASLLAALVTLLFTTASDTLVSPHWIPVSWSQDLLYGPVQARFASLDLMETLCEQTTLTQLPNSSHASLSCLLFSQTANSLSDFTVFLQDWSYWDSDTTDGLPYETSIVAKRFAPDTYVLPWIGSAGTWIAEESSNVTSSYEKFSRIVNNMTLAMPHSVTAGAAQELASNAPEDFSIAALDSVGSFSLIAAVVSPSSNVLCANVNKSEIAPLVYSEWLGARFRTDQETGDNVIPWDGWESDTTPTSSSSLPNSTVVDDLFEWGARPPIFSMWPADGNATLNNSVPFSDAIYILIKSPMVQDYTVCRIKVFLSYGCSSEFSVSATGYNILAANCTSGSKMLYNPTESELHASSLTSFQARDALAALAEAIGLGTTVGYGYSPVPRFLAEMIPSIQESESPSLSPTLPSIAEGISALLASFLVQSTINSTFNLLWDPKDPPILPNARDEPFNTTLYGAEYKSGPVLPSQRGFYAILILMFAGNLTCLAHFIFVLHAELDTDCTEPQNAFAMAINSPWSRNLAETYGVMPRSKQLAKGWHLRQNVSSHYYFSDIPAVHESHESELREDSVTMNECEGRREHGDGHAGKMGGLP